MQKAAMIAVADTVPKAGPVLIAGPTASGKSALALTIARRRGGVIVNADALQVFGDWRILTARPDTADLAQAPHRLYGHVPGDRAYSVGAWIRDVAALRNDARLIFTGGTGLYFAALTQGLAEIPDTPPDIRARATDRIARGGPGALLDELDPPTAAQIDRANPMRVQRAWEVLMSTGRGLAAWQADTGPAPVPLDRATALVLAPDRDRLAARISDRFQAMLRDGVMDEVAANAPHWRADLPSAKAIGAAQLMAVHRGDITLEAAGQQVITLTRQYAKRQRSWFRARMRDWNWIDPSE